MLLRQALALALALAAACCAPRPAWGVCYTDSCGWSTCALWANNRDCPSGCSKAGGATGSGCGGLDKRERCARTTWDRNAFRSRAGAIPPLPSPRGAKGSPARAQVPKRLVPRPCDLAETPWRPGI